MVKSQDGQQHEEQKLILDTLVSTEFEGKLILGFSSIWVKHSGSITDNLPADLLEAEYCGCSVLPLQNP